MIIRRSIIVMAILCVAFGLVRFLPSGYDFDVFWYPIAQKLQDGTTQLYDDASREYFAAPWMMLYFVPVSWLGRDAGLFVLMVTTIITIIFVMEVLAQEQTFPRVATYLAMINFPMFSLLFLGQVDFFPLLGMIIGWWGIRQRKPWALGLGFWFMVFKPINVILVGLLFLLEIRHWHWHQWLKVFSLPIVSLVMAMPVCGTDWIIRYIQNPGQHQPDDTLIQTIWRAADQLGIPTLLVALVGLAALAVFLKIAWQQGVNRWTLSLALATNLLFTPYAYNNHYLLLLPVFLWISAGNTYSMVLLYAIMNLTPVLRAAFSLDPFPLDILYPLVIYIMLWTGFRSLEPKVASPVERDFHVPAPAPGQSPFRRIRPALVPPQRVCRCPGVLLYW